MKFLVIGCGSIGKRHIRNLRTAGAVNIAACDPSEERRNEAAKLYGVDPYPDIESALEKGVDVALVCSPTSMHLDQTFTLVRAGCHLFVEKPVSHTLEGLDKISDEIQKRKLKTLVGCNFRFHPGLVKAHELLEEGVMGRVMSVRANFGQYLPDWHPWEDYRNGYSANKDLGGGVLLDRIHEIDYTRWLFGGVKSVTAMIDKISSLEIDTEDTVEMIVRFESGAIGSIHLDYLRRFSDCSLDVTCENGVVVWSFHANCVRWYISENKKWEEAQWPDYDANDMYLAQTRHFLDILAGNVKSCQDYDQGMQALKIAEAARLSSATGGAITL